MLARERWVFYLCGQKITAREMCVCLTWTDAFSVCSSAAHPVSVRWFFSDFAVLPLVFCPSWVASFLSLSFPNN